MITLRLPAREFLCLAPNDMRKNSDGLASVVTSTMAANPLAGDLFVFRGKRGDGIKLLYFDGDGFSLWYKRMATRCGTSEWKKTRSSSPLPIVLKASRGSRSVPPTW